ncbi:MAG: hypothetical protein V8R91_19455 [Butyricimonas faecihominis]
MEYVHELCKEEYNGRLAGTGEYMKCAFWCAEQLCDFGLEPAGMMALICNIFGCR